MTPALTLLGWAVVVGPAGTRLLSRSARLRQIPGTAVWLWLGLSTSVVIALVLAGLALALPRLPATATVADFFHACASAVQLQYSTPGGRTASALGIVLSLLLVARLAFVGLGQRRSSRRLHSEHDRLVTVARTGGHPPLAQDVAAWCTGGRSRHIVVTTAASAALTESQLGAVIEHERAHLRRHHHAAVTWASWLETALCGWLGTRRSRLQVEDLVELDADDAVTERDRGDLARAVLIMALGQAPRTTVSSLGATGGAVAERVARLRGPATASAAGRWLRLLIVTGVVPALLAGPVALLLAPGVRGALAGLCPLLY